MSKNKNMYGVICKSIHKSRHRRDGGDYPSTKFPIRSGVVSFLFFQIFICLAVLMMTPNVWAGLTGLTVDAGGDLIFRGGRLDRLLITFTVDEDAEGDPYIVKVGTIGDNATFRSQGVIEQGTVSADQTTISFRWDGTVNGTQLPDGVYTIQVELVDESLTAQATLDASAPRLSSVRANSNTGPVLTEGSFINQTLNAITVTRVSEGSPLEFDEIGLGGNQTRIVLVNSRGTTVAGSLTYNDAAATELTYTLGNPLDTAAENGSYTIGITLTDKARNTVQIVRRFTFDNVAPSVTSVATNRGAITSGAGVNQRLNYVEATLSDNLEGGVDLFTSKVRLTDSNGALVLGRQTNVSATKIRWNLLSPFLGRDSLQDGVYTIRIIGIDRAGNQAAEPVEVSFTYDNLAPELVALSPTKYENGQPFNLVGDTVYHNLPLTQFVATFDDLDTNGGQGIGVGLVGGRRVSRIVFGTPGENGINALAGKPFWDTDPEGKDRLTYVLDKSIVSRDGSQDGRYILNVQATDRLGNTRTYNYRLIYDTQLPTLISTTPAANATVSELSQVIVKLNEKTSGIDIERSFQLTGDVSEGQRNFRLTRDEGGVQVDVPVNITSNGTDTITLTLTEPIALDGSDDGTYRIEITPTDRAGNSGTTAVREFYLVSQRHEPEIRLTMPETTTVNSLATITADIVDYKGAGLDFDASTLTVRNSQGALIAQEDLVRDETSNSLTWMADAPVARDGSADGAYTVTATFVDFTGRRFTQEFPIVLDTQFPAIESIQVAAESPTSLAEDRTTDIADSVGQITVAFDETAGDVDFGATVVSLMGPGETVIPVNRVDNGQAVLTLNFQTLTQRGEYTLSITPQDLAGNQSTAPFVYRFRIDVALPVVSSVLIDGKSGTIVYANGSAANIVATFADLSGVGVALGDGGSTIAVTNPNGIPAPGITTSNGTNQLTWTPIVLPTDGSADGRYTVAVTPIDNAGRQGDVVYRQFVYDTQEPRITAATPLTLNAPVSYVSGGLNQLTFTVADVVPGEGIEPSDILWESQTIELLDASGTAVPTALTYDELSSQLYLTLSSPFAQDGSADGEYTVKLRIVDRSQNLLDAEYTFIYDSQVPSLSSVMVNTEPPVALVPNRITEILESVSSVTFEFEEATRVDFANTQVTLTGPSGEAIPLTLEDNGTTGLTASFLPLVQVGMYTLSVTAQDVAGNVASGAVDYRFTLDLALPLVSSVLIDGKAGTIVYVNGTAANIVANFADLGGVGVALGDSGSTIAVTSPSGIPAPGITTATGENQLTWSPIVLPTDGSADGRYTVTVTPIDNAGRQGDVVYRQFVYDTQEPRITAATSLTLNAPVSYVSGGLSQFTFTIEDVVPGEGIEPSDILWESQTIELLDASGTAVPTALTYDELSSQLYLTLSSPFAQDGSVDGEYTVKLGIVDKAGNRLDSEHIFIYDSQVPGLSSVMVNAESPVVLITESITDISESISGITLEFEETTRVDFTNTQVILTGPGGETIPLTLEDNGTTGLTASFLSLDQIGVYTLSVTAQDIAGNVASGAVNYRFALDLTLPSVSSVVIGGKSGDVVFINGGDPTIVATFSDDTRTSLTGEGSSITVTDVSGAAVAGQTRVEGSNQLIWQPLSLPADGSVDGRYTVTITPVNIAGRRGEVVYREFIYDTEEPQITASSPLTLSQPVSYISGDLRQLTFTVADVGPADLLWESQTIALLDASGNMVPTALTFDELSSQLYLTLSSPFAQDGSVDGEYTVELGIVDKAENRLDVEHTFIYDSQVPRLSSVMVNTETPVELIPGGIADISESIGSITLAFEEMARVDFENTVITLMGPDEVAIPLTLEDNGTTGLTASFLPLREVGMYTLSVTAQDIAGNVASGAVDYRFALDLALPSVSSVVIGGKSGDVVFINGSDPTIVATFSDDTGTGLTEGGSSVVVTNASGTAVPGQTRVEGGNQLIWHPLSLPTDGSVDGRYTVTITPVNIAGRRGEVVYREFIYDTEAPQITASSPLTLSQPVSYVSGALNQLTFTVADVGPSDILWESQTIALLDASGNMVPTALTFDELSSQLYLTLLSPFAQDGSADGEYTVKLGIVDKAGNRLDVEHAFIYDSQVPRLSSVIVNTDPSVELVPNRIAEIVESISSITLAFEEATRIDFTNTQVILTGPGGEAIPLTLEDNGTTGLAASFLPLVQVGMYTLSVTAQDVAGNVASGAVDYRFTLDLALPLVSSVLIDGKSGTLVYVNGTAANIVATFADLSGVGVALGDSGSTIAVTNPSGILAPGITTATGENQLTWSPIVLPTDGSADGRYTVTITPIDNAGRQGDVIYRQFVYDTQEPRITAATSLTLNAPVSYVSGGLSQFTFTIADVIPGEGIEPSDILWESQTIALLDASGNTVPGTLTYDELSSQLYLTLSSPFAQDGSVDGEYTVKLGIVDKAGNRLEVEHAFIYDSQVPGLSSVMVNAESPVELMAEGITDISESISSITLEFEEATRVDFTNTQVTLTGMAGESIPLTLEDNGMTGLMVSFVSLREVGVYTLSVTAQDVAGNVASGAVNYRFSVDLTLPSVSSVMIGGKSGDVVFINGSDPTIVATFSDDTGMRLTEGGSSIVVTNASGAAVPGQMRVEGGNQLIWHPLSLPTDGSIDGRYTVEITPVDTSGQRGEVVSREFIYDTEAPQITASSPLILSQPVSYVNGALSQFTFTVADVGPSDLVLAEQTVILVDAAGDPVSSVVTHDELTNQLYLTLSSPFAQDGSVDGEYTVKLGIVDKAGNRLDSEHAFIYDSQVPGLSSVMVNTESPVELTAEGITDISELISSITLAFEEATRVDFTNTQVTLTGTAGESIPLTLKDNGVTGLIASFLSLRQVGVYTLSITAQDVAGNVASGAVNYRFALDLTLPSVSSVVIGGKSGDVVFINGGDPTIVATFSDDTRTSLTGEGSSITVTDVSGAAVAGQTRVEGSNQLIWQALSLPTDGSVDGRYTVEVTPVDTSGQRGEVVYREFIYDTEEPQITASSPLTLSQPVSYISGDLRQLTFTVADVGPSDLLWESQTIALLDASGNAVPATVTFDELSSQLYLTLSSPFAQDGSVDGEYTVELGIVDKAENRLDVEHTFIYDSQVPSLSSVMVNTDPPVELVPNRIAEILASISSITLKFEEATLIDFANTQITLMGPDPSGEIDASGVPIESEFPLTLQDDGASQVTVNFLKLERIGSYTLSITPRDVAGNAASGPVAYRFFLDIPLPRVTSIVIGESETTESSEVAYVNASNMIIGAFLIDPTETGLSFGTEGSSITVTESDGTTVVRGALGSNGTDLIVWEPIGLTSDGTTDGRYNVYVIPVDQAGRQGSIVYREFVYDTQEPEITAAAPIDLSQPISYISRSLTQLRFTVEDVGPADLILADQQVSLRNANGSLVPAQLTNDTENQLFLTLDQPLPLDGSMDGEYTVLIALADKAGNPYTVEHLIIYDTQAPTLVSTVPADGALLTEDVTEIQVTLNDEGGSRIDWAMTSVILVDPNGAQISGELVSDGATKLTLTTNQLVADGRYIIRVQAVDRAGNGNATVFERNFLLSRRLPTVVSTEPTTAPKDEAFTNEELEQVEVRLETDDENHLSTLRLLNNVEQVVAGQQRRTSNRLIYDLVRPLATDGSEDGVYTIEFTPISASGRSGGVQRFTFTYDTQSPEIETDEVISLVVVQPEVNNSLTEIRVSLTDETSGIDWKNLDEKWLTFERLSPNPTKISGRVSDDGQGNLTFRLTVPLADNGSADGEYKITIEPKDRAGNDDEPYQKVFVYDTNPPTIDESTLLINELPLLVDINAVDYPTAVSTTGGVVIQANIFDTGLGVNLAQSRITVRGPDGSEISGSTQQNGVDTLIFKSDGLTLQGVYKITVVSVGNDSELLGFAPTDSITTEFLYETTEPTAAITSDGGETELTDKALPLEGTASDPAGTQRVGEGEIPVPASGVWLVEIVGTGPDKQPIEPVAAVDDSDAEQEPWSVWSIDFLPTRSGEYDLDVRVTDNAGNYAIYDIGEYTMSVSLTFRGTTFGWPNPLRLSKRDVAFFSFDVNVPLGDTIELTLSIYDWSGDMVLSQTYPDVVSGQRNDQLVKWNLENQAGTPVARGLYVFRLEAVNAAGNRANVVGKVLVVE